MSAQSGSAAAPAARPSATRYRVGDYVVYAYTGAALKAPVTLTEEIVAQQGLRLEIQVTARRGDEERRWVQVVTDTPENRKNERLDALYLVEGGQRQRLANEGNADAYRLYEWVIPPIGSPLRDKRQSPCTVDVAGRRYELTCTSGKQTVGGREAAVELCDGEAFLWTKARTIIRAVDGGKLLYQMVVQDAGKRSTVGKTWAEISIYWQTEPEPWGEGDQIAPFFGQYDIAIHGVRSSSRAVCEAEHCPRSTKTEVLVDEGQLAQLYAVLLSYPHVVDQLRKGLPRHPASVPVDQVKTAFEIPADGPNNGSGCMQRRGFASRILGEALAQASRARCSADAECELVGIATGCAGSCPTAIHRRLREPFSAFRQRLKARVCARYREAGCPYLTPRCVRMKAACVAGICQTMRDYPPSHRHP